jgi:hypothetical protein
MFLNNHREAIAAMDFFTVPTLTIGNHRSAFRSWIGRTIPQTVVSRNGGAYLLRRKLKRLRGQISAMPFAPTSGSA